MSQHLYEYGSELRGLFEEMASEEYSDEFDLERITAAEGAFEAKAEDVAKFIRHMKATAEMFKTEAARMVARATAATNKAARCAEYLQREMEAIGRDKIKGEKLTITLAKCPVSCTVTDVEVLHDGFKIIEQVIRVDKRKIIKWFRETGNTPNGSEIVSDKRTLRIR